MLRCRSRGEVVRTARRIRGLRRRVSQLERFSHALHQIAPRIILELAKLGCFLKQGDRKARIRSVKDRRMAVRVTASDDAVSLDEGFAFLPKEFAEFR